MKKLVVCLLAITMVLGLSIPAIMAADADFAPSVEVKPTPEIVAPETDSDINVGAIINKVDDTKENVAKDVMLSVSYDEAKEMIENKDTNGITAEEEAVCQALVDAYNDLKENGVKGSVENIDEFVAENLAIEAPAYFVSHVFELNLGSENADKLEGEASVTVRFDNAGVNAKAGALVVAHMVDEKWVIVPNDCVVVTEDYIEVTFDDLCPVMFLHVEEDENAGGQDSETTSEIVGGQETESKDVETNTQETEPKDDENKDDKDNFLVPTIIILSITVVIVVGIVVYYILEKKGVIKKLSQGSKK